MQGAQFFKRSRLAAAIVMIGASSAVQAVSLGADVSDEPPPRSAIARPGESTTTIGVLAQPSANAQAPVTLTRAAGMSDLSPAPTADYGLSVFASDGLVSIANRSIAGLLGGARLLPQARLELDNVQLTGTSANSAGLVIEGGSVLARNSALVGEREGVFLAADNQDEARLVLDNTQVSAQNGAAIRIVGGAPTAAYLEVRNGSTLTGSNGNALEVSRSATANVVASQSELAGNVVVSASSSADIELNAARWAGNLQVDGSSTGSLSLANGSQWTGDLTNVQRVQLDGSRHVGNTTVNNGRAASVLLANGSLQEGNITNVDTLTLDGSQLIGDLSTEDGRRAELLATNGSRLVGNVDNVDLVSLDNSQLTGNVGASDGRATELSLTRGAALLGNALNVDRITLDQALLSGDVTVTDGRAAQLSLANGSVLEGNVTHVDTVALDASRLLGNITVDEGRTASVSLSNGSVLTGNVTNVDTLVLDRSQLVGDVTAHDARTSSIALRNGALLDGALANVNALSISGNATWNLSTPHDLTELSLDRGQVRFANTDGHLQLNVGQLSGAGTFALNADYQANRSDTLNVSGTASGTHSLFIKGSGLEPITPEALTLVRTAGGDASFTLAGDAPVDLGTWSYALGAKTDDAGGTQWFLDPSRKTISPGTQSVLALFNAGPTIAYAEQMSVRSRTGDLRLTGGAAGGWLRTYSNQYDVSGHSGLGYRQTQSGFTLGADVPLASGDGQWLAGVLAGYSRSGLNVSRGTSGSVDSHYLGAYTTWLDSGSGYYFDASLKANRFNNESKVSISDGTRAKGDYSALGASGSVEFGRNITLNDGWFVEPYGQLSAAVIQGKDYVLDNGLRAKADATRSLLGKAGSLAGRNVRLESGTVIQPYLKAAVVHEFASGNRVRVNGNSFRNDLSGTRGEVGAGISVAFSDRFGVHADIDHAKGAHIEQPYGVNLGLRYTW